jgi:hypothetical protein
MRLTAALWRWLWNPEVFMASSNVIVQMYVDTFNFQNSIERYSNPAFGKGYFPLRITLASIHGFSISQVP